MPRPSAAGCRRVQDSPGNVCALAASLRCDDSETDDRVDRAGCRALGVRSIVAVPIRRGNRVVGLIEVFSSQPYAFTPEDISVLQQLSSTILSVAGNKAEAHAPASSLPRPPSQEKRAVRVEERVDARVEEAPHRNPADGSVAG